MAESSVARALRAAYMGLPPTTVMEVCGTHTHAIAKHGLRQLLPPNLRLVSGPGCPVCVTADADIRAALFLGRRAGTTLFSFGDMLRVPVAGGQDSLYRARGLGRDVRIAISPMDALAFAEANPARSVVWFGVGFETTAPHTAAAILRARARGIGNFCVLSSHKTMPAALLALLRGVRGIDALLCPGHVAVITGARAFGFVPEILGLPAAVAGFEPDEIASGLAALADLRRGGAPGLVNAYPAVVTNDGNRAAQAIMRAVFEPCAAAWRGLGEIADSGLRLRAEFADWDARARFDLPPDAPDAPTACRCADVLRGAITPRACPLFGAACTPDMPHGPCMVSGEGACAAEYLYGCEGR